MTVRLRAFLLTLFVIAAGFTGAALASEAKREGSGQKYTFQAEVNRLMDIIVHSLYSKKDVFLRELISNASDALDKIRILSLTDRSQMEAQPDLDIRMSVDKDNKILLIRDSGVGMTRQDLISHLGTIAKSGTAAFLEQYKQAQDSNLIGQFGVGFYSAYLVADYVEVVTKHNNDTQLVWASRADGTFTIDEDNGAHPDLGRGTLIKLHLRDDCPEYLEEGKLTSLATKYSEFISYPIFINSTEFVEVERPVKKADKPEAKEEEADADPEAKEETEETTVEDAKEGEEEEVKMEKVREPRPLWKKLNDKKAIWTRPASEVNESEYHAFYKSAFKREWEEPLSYLHFKGEGDVEFKALLFVPPTADNGYFDKYYEKAATNIRFYVRRVFISDDFELMPRYLGFIRGVVDSDTLPLNIGREQLQHTSALKVIKKKLVRKALDVIKKLAEPPAAEKAEEETEAETKETKPEPVNEKYDKFYGQFGKAIRMGVIEDTDNRNRLSKLLRYRTTKSDGKLVSLESYVSRMKEGQKGIYYLGGNTFEELEASPFVEYLKEEGYEVILFTDPLDEYVMTHLQEYDGKKLMDASKEDLDLVDDVKRKKLDAQFSKLTSWWRKAVSAEDDQVESVKVSPRLTKSPCVVVVTKYGYSPNMQRIIRAQTMGGNQDSLKYMSGKRILEINPRHPVVQHVKDLFEQEGEDSPRAKSAALVMYETAVLESGLEIKAPKGFASRVYELMNSAFEVGHGREAEPVDVAAQGGETEDEAEDAATGHDEL